MQDFLCALQDWSLYLSQSCGIPIIKSCWPTRSYSLAIPTPFDITPGWEAWRGAQNLYNIGKTSLVLLFSSLWVTHLAGMVFDFTVIARLQPSHCNFFIFGWAIPLLVGPASSCRWSTASFSFGALTGEDECIFYSAILNQSFYFFFTS